MSTPYETMRNDWLDKRLHCGHHFNLGIFDDIYKLGAEEALDTSKILDDELFAALAKVEELEKIYEEYSLRSITIQEELGEVEDHITTLRRFVHHQGYCYRILTGQSNTTPDECDCGAYAIMTATKQSWVSGDDGITKPDETTSKKAEFEGSLGDMLVDCTEYFALVAERDAAVAKVEEARKVLKSVQWVLKDDGRYAPMKFCPSCGTEWRNRRSEHRVGCRLDKFLAATAPEAAMCICKVGDKCGPMPNEKATECSSSCGACHD